MMHGSFFLSHTEPIALCLREADRKTTGCLFWPTHVIAPKKAQLVKLTRSQTHFEIRETFSTPETQ